MNFKIRKKTGKLEEFDGEKIIAAVDKSADRVLVKFTENEHNKIIEIVYNTIISMEKEEIDVPTMHKCVELALDKINGKVADSYRQYRNYKSDFVSILDKVYLRDRSLRFMGDRSNSNTDSTLVSTRRVLSYREFNSELYNKFNLNELERQAIEDGFIYIHDKSDRRDTYNCCLFDVPAVMTGGFEMGNMWYNEPTDIDKACDVLGDIIAVKAAQQYGGLTIPEVDKTLAPYVKKSHIKFREEMIAEQLEFDNTIVEEGSKLYEYIDKKALEKARTDLEDGMQGIEYKANSVGSSRGDYPFLTFTFGEDTEDPYAVMVSEAILKVRKEGQGKKGKKKCVLFPKLVFLYVEEKHGEGKPYEDLFKQAIECSAKCMYPDFLSLTGEGYVPSVYKKYKKIISPMG